MYFAGGELAVHRRCVPSIFKIPLPTPAVSVQYTPVVTGAGKVQNTLGSNLIDSLTNNAILERRIVHVNLIINNHTATVFLEGQDISRKVFRARVTSGKIKLCSRGEGMHDLQHRRSFAGARCGMAVLTWKHGYVT